MCDWCQTTSVKRIHRRCTVCMNWKEPSPKPHHVRYFICLDCSNTTEWAQRHLRQGKKIKPKLLKRYSS
jgi:hypothetical protein